MLGCLRKRAMLAQPRQLRHALSQSQVCHLGRMNALGLQGDDGLAYGDGLRWCDSWSYMKYKGIQAHKVSMFQAQGAQLLTRS